MSLIPKLSAVEAFSGNPGTSARSFIATANLALEIDIQPPIPEYEKERANNMVGKVLFVKDSRYWVVGQFEFGVDLIARTSRHPGEGRGIVC